MRRGRGWGEGEESRFLTRAPSKMELLLTEMEKTGGRVSLVVPEGRSAGQLWTCLIPEADEQPRWFGSTGS